MATLNYENYHVYAIGDIHGNFKELVYKINNLLSNSIVFVCGDCGIGFEKEIYYINMFEHLNKKLINKNNIILLIRGNHDNPLYFNDKPLIYSNIRTLPDYTVCNIINNDDVNNILCVGGAISIDRTYRLRYDYDNSKYSKNKNKTYWDTEQFLFDIDKIDAIDKNINILLTHASPHNKFEYDNSNIKHFIDIDYNLYNDLNIEKDNIKGMVEYLLNNNHNIKLWLNGHYHNHFETYVNYGDINIKCVTLNNIENSLDIYDIC